MLRRFAPLRILLGAAAFTAPGTAFADEAETRLAIIRMLADVTLIDQHCHNVATSFGPAFQASEALGFEPADIMPTGRLRSEFVAAMQDRLAATSQATLCGEIADRYANDLPGTIKQP